MEKPKTIHDFSGFPRELYEVQYAVKGAIDFAKETQTLVTKTKVQPDLEWGLDHGTWSIIMPMYPDADIPVFQLSIDYTRPPQFHYDLARELSSLRKKGLLIVGSGNIVHNLGMVAWNNKEDFAYDWAIEFDVKIKNLINEGNHESIMAYEKLGTTAKLSVPTNDHYLPLLYSLALQEKNEPITFFNEKCTMGSVSMRSLKIG
jgi:4,5-DOPA dioxygenase extradiol